MPSQPNASTVCAGPHGPDTRTASRRAFLQHAGAGFGWLALTSMLARENLLADTASSPEAPRTPHFLPRAERVIFLFMSGGPSHLETFDPKPELQRLHGQRLPDSFGRVQTRRRVDRNKLLATKRTFRKFGQSGIEVSDWLPHTATCVDDLCVLRGCYGDSVTHPESVYLMNTGSILMGRPSLGAWVSYGLGTENQNLPSYVVLPDPAGWVKGARRPGDMATCLPPFKERFCGAPIHRCCISSHRRAFQQRSSGGRSTSFARPTSNSFTTSMAIRNCQPA